MDEQSRVDLWLWKYSERVQGQALSSESKAIFYFYQLDRSESECSGTPLAYSWYHGCTASSQEHFHTLERMLSVYTIKILSLLCITFTPGDRIMHASPLYDMYVLTMYYQVQVRLIFDVIIRCPLLVLQLSTSKHQPLLVRQYSIFGLYFSLDISYCISLTYIHGNGPPSECPNEHLKTYMQCNTVPSYRRVTNFQG